MFALNLIERFKMTIHSLKQTGNATPASNIHCVFIFISIKPNTFFKQRIPSGNPVVMFFMALLIFHFILAIVINWGRSPI